LPRGSKNIANDIHTRTHEKSSRKRFCDQSEWFIEIREKTGLIRVLIFSGL